VRILTRGRPAFVIGLTAIERDSLGRPFHWVYDEGQYTRILGTTLLNIDRDFLRMSRHK
jgi:hypothetical protein